MRFLNDSTLSSALQKDMNYLFVLTKTIINQIIQIYRDLQGNIPVVSMKSGNER